MNDNANANDIDQKYGIRNMTLVIGKRLRMEGFIVGDPDFGPKYFKERNERIGAVSFSLFLLLLFFSSFFFPCHMVCIYLYVVN